MRQILITILILFMAGCSLTKPVALHPVSRYVINHTADKKVYLPKINKTLLVTVPKASPGYGTANMIYVDTPYQIKTFTHNQWVAPPSHMLLPLVMQTLQNSNRFRAVVGEPFSGVADYRLDSHLFILQQDFQKRPNQVHLKMQFELIDNVTNKVIFVKKFDVSVPTRRSDPYGGVVAANIATSRMLTQMAQAVVKAVN